MKIVGTNISMIRGDSEEIKISCRDENQNLVPLVDGDTIYFTIKANPNLEQKVLQKIITNFIDGVAFISILPADTQSLKFGNYYYDIQLNRSDGQVKTIIPLSKFVVELEVTYD